MQELMKLFGPGNTAIYLLAGLLGLYVQYQTAKANARTTAASFWDYWLKETPGMSLATVVVLVTVAGATIQSGILTAMTGWGVFTMGFLKGFGFDALIQAPPSGPAKAQGGFVRPAMLAVLLALSLVALPGCGLMPKGADIPVSQQLPPAAQAAQVVINQANYALASGYGFIRDGVRDGTVDPKQGRVWYLKLDDLKSKIDAAQALLKQGSFDAAKAQAAAVQALIKLLQDELVKAAAKKST